MKLPRFPIFLVVAFLAGLGGASLRGQSLKIASLKHPDYPAMARAARVSGDVTLAFSILADGTPTDLRVVSGPPMLQQAAMDSAKGSRFQPAQGSNAGTPLELTYKFKIEVLDCDQTPDSSYPRVQFDANVVTVTGQIVTLCDPEAAIRVRSIKCLYFWRCSIK